MPRTSLLTSKQRCIQTGLELKLVMSRSIGREEHAEMVRDSRISYDCLAYLETMRVEHFECIHH